MLFIFHYKFISGSPHFADVNEGSGGLREGDWSYSAEHFSDLKTYMFIDSSDEEF